MLLNTSISKLLLLARFAVAFAIIILKHLAEFLELDWLGHEGVDATAEGFLLSTCACEPSESDYGGGFDVVGSFVSTNVACGC